MRALTAEEEEALYGYGWVDQAGGVARVPIARAMEMLANQELPAVAPAARQGGELEGRPRDRDHDYRSLQFRCVLAGDGHTLLCQRLDPDQTTRCGIFGVCVHLVHFGQACHVLEFRSRFIETIHLRKRS